MNNVQHLWNVINHLSSNPHPEVIGLQSYYVQRCRELESEVELPKKIFGPGMMCAHCGSLWSQVGSKVRFESGRRQGKSIKKIASSGKKVSRFKETLVKKAAKNSGNKAIVRCPFCSKCTKINMTKPARLKAVPDAKINANENHTPSNKKRKKRTKDKTAGLIITPLNKSQELKKIPKKEKTTNLNKLGAMINRNLTPSKKSSLHDFITDLA